MTSQWTSGHTNPCPPDVHSFSDPSCTTGGHVGVWGTGPIGPDPALESAARGPNDSFSSRGVSRRGAEGRKARDAGGRSSGRRAGPRLDDRAMSGMGYRHEAFLYADAGDYVDTVGRFIRDGVAAGEAVMVAVAPERIDEIAEAVDGAADAVRWVDMHELGRNPARIIPEWQRFLDEHDRERPLRGVGEPIWPGRSADEVVECQQHEALLNMAVPPDRPLWLMCP